MVGRCWTQPDKSVFLVLSFLLVIVFSYFGNKNCEGGLFLDGTLSALPWLAALFQFQSQKHSPLMNHLAHIKVFSSHMGEPFVCCPAKSFRQSPSFMSRNLSIGFLW